MEVAGKIKYKTQSTWGDKKKGVGGDLTHSSIDRS
jgi:hypothetical protein